MRVEDCYFTLGVSLHGARLSRIRRTLHSFVGSAPWLSRWVPSSRQIESKNHRSIRKAEYNPVGSRTISSTFSTAEKRGPVARSCSNASTLSRGLRPKLQQCRREDFGCSQRPGDVPRRVGEEPISNSLHLATYQKLSRDVCWHLLRPAPAVCVGAS